MSTSTPKERGFNQVVSQARHAPEQIGIYRQFLKARGGYYLHVALRRNGQTFQKYFIEKQHGSETRTMKLAQAWRDSIILAHPSMSMQQFCSIVRTNNTSGMPGVSRVVKRKQTKDGRESILSYWQARLPLPDGRLLFRNFSTLKLGEDVAKRLAIEARTGALDALDGVAFRAKSQPRIASTASDLAMLDEALRVSQQDRHNGEANRAAKTAQKAERLAAKLAHALETERLALTKSTNRSGEPYIGRHGKEDAKNGYWRVSMTRQGIRHRKSFSDSVYGSAEEALQAAKTWRDKLFVMLPATSRAQAVSRLKGNNSSGVAGVTRVRVVRNSQLFQYWVAHSPVVKGQPKRSTSYSIEKHGEAEALALAAQAREAFVNQLGEHTFLHHRAARQVAVTIKSGP